MDSFFTVYTRKNCPWCTKLKTWMNDRHLQFEEKDIGLDNVYLEELKQCGAPAVPYTILKNKDEVIETLLGFDEKKAQWHVRKKVNPFYSKLRRSYHYDILQ